MGSFLTIFGGQKKKEKKVVFCAAAHAHRAGKQPLCEAGGINSADGRRDISSVLDR